MRALKVRSTVVSLRKLTITQRIIKAGPLPTTWEVAKELNTDHSTDIQHVKQTGKVKRLEKWVPNELTANQKIVLKSCLLLFYAITNYISIRLWPEMKSGFYTTRLGQQARRLDQEAPKHFPKPNLHQKETMVTVWWSGATLIHYSFLNPSETTASEEYAQQVNEMQQKLQHLQPILVKRLGLNENVWQHNTQPMLQNNKSRKFCIICHINLTSSQPTTTSSSISTTFAGKNASTASRRQKILSKSSWNPEAQIFMLQE